NSTWPRQSGDPWVCAASALTSEAVVTNPQSVHRNSGTAARIATTAGIQTGNSSELSSVKRSDARVALDARRLVLVRHARAHVERRPRPVSRVAHRLPPERVFLLGAPPRLGAHADAAAKQEKEPRRDREADERRDVAAGQMLGDRTLVDRGAHERDHRRE